MLNFNLCALVFSCFRWNFHCLLLLLWHFYLHSRCISTCVDFNRRMRDDRLYILWMVDQRGIMRNKDWIKGCSLFDFLFSMITLFTALLFGLLLLLLLFFFVFATIFTLFLMHFLFLMWFRDTHTLLNRLLCFLFALGKCKVGLGGRFQHKINSSLIFTHNHADQ